MGHDLGVEDRHLVLHREAVEDRVLDLRGPLVARPASAEGHQVQDVELQLTPTGSQAAYQVEDHRLRDPRPVTRLEILDRERVGPAVIQRRIDDGR